ncbi:unnamed protein product [Pieris brassicae]|uniref:Uncharacterized protein n=1 Tax=Pieris brassicae TaxID=7116 RepID=A0A9P0SRW7_PIEBR|nr:unnamed protein product [Pieris brassicae]
MNIFIYACCGSPKFFGNEFLNWNVTVILYRRKVGSQSAVSPPPHGPLDASAGNRHLHNRLASQHVVIGITWTGPIYSDILTLLRRWRFIEAPWGR